MQSELNTLPTNSALQKYGELPETTKINETDAGEGDDEAAIEFAEGSEEEDDDDLDDL